MDPRDKPWDDVTGSLLGRLSAHALTRRLGKLLVIPARLAGTRADPAVLDLRQTEGLMLVQMLGWIPACPGMTPVAADYFAAAAGDDGNFSPARYCAMALISSSERSRIRAVMVMKLPRSPLRKSVIVLIR